MLILESLKALTFNVERWTLGDRQRCNLHTGMSCPIIWIDLILTTNDAWAMGPSSMTARKRTVPSAWESTERDALHVTIYCHLQKGNCLPSNQWVTFTDKRCFRACLSPDSDLDHENRCYVLNKFWRPCVVFRPTPAWNSFTAESTDFGTGSSVLHQCRLSVLS